MKKIILFALCIFVSGAMFAQTTVTGTVIGSDDRNPIPFASVHVDGTTNLVFTDDDGKYSIGNVPGDGALIISVMGYVTQKVSVNGRAVINVELHPGCSAAIRMQQLRMGTKVLTCPSTTAARPHSPILCPPAAVR